MTGSRFSALYSAPAPHAPAQAPHLVCVPYAGGSVRSFWNWPDGLPGVKVHLAQLPGRGRNAAQPLPESIEEVADGLATAVCALPEGEVAIFGHSLGALIAFELAVRMTDSGRPPARLFASGCVAPDISRPRRHHLPDEEFLVLLRGLGATPREFFEAPELLELYLPVLRCDFRLAETYRPDPRTAVGCPLDVLSGRLDDAVSTADLEGWHTRSTGPVARAAFPGDHFFLHQCEPAVLRHVGAALASHRPQLQEREEHS
ncbi:thioesterase II family protein [Streptomyces sp. NPDC059906]|uniref:thioesterase II family protein n=1 Tax=Streptomyces sp. NPDC059906 TaxID=3346997 RepID=UPI0036491728